MNDDLKKLYLIRLFGGVLSDEDERKLGAWAAGDDGIAYARTTDDVASLLKEIAMVQVTAVDGSEMVHKFESMVRNDFTQWRKNLRWALPCTVGLWTVLGVTDIVNNGVDSLLGWFLITTSCLLLASVGWIFFWQRSLLNNPDPVNAMRGARRHAHRPLVRAANWALSIVLLGGMAWFNYKALGETQLYAFLAFLPLFFTGMYIMQRRKRGKNPDLHEWWEEDFRKEKRK